MKDARPIFVAGLRGDSLACSGQERVVIQLFRFRAS
jgi:hypothetical protein